MLNYTNEPLTGWASDRNQTSPSISACFSNADELARDPGLSVIAL